MRNTSKIKIEIPLPWGATPVRIEASGRYAVVVAGIVAVLFLLILAVSHAHGA
jgi:uncharacterized integral membrane protein